MYQSEQFVLVIMCIIYVIIMLKDSMWCPLQITWYSWCIEDLFICIYIYILSSHSSINHLFSVYSQCFLYAFSWVGAVEFVVCFHNLDNHNEEICNDSGKKNWWPGTDIGKKLMTWHRYWEKIDKIEKLTIKKWSFIH